VADKASGYSSRAEIIKQAVRDFIEKKKVTAQERHLEVPSDNPKNKSRVNKTLKRQPRNSDELSFDLEMDEPDEISSVFYDQPTEKRKNDR